MLDFKDLKVLLYYWGDYILCAPQITYNYQECGDKIYEATPIDRLYVIRLNDEKLFNESKKYVLTPSIRRIAASNEGSLLITIKHKDSFFEVECSSIEGSAGSTSLLAQNVVFHSFVFNREEMADSLLEALSKLNVATFYPDSDIVLSIEKLLTEEDVRKINGSRSLPSGSHSSDYNSSFFLDMPDWSNNRGKDLTCSLQCMGKTIVFEIVKDDLPFYNLRSDRDGGWFYNSKKESIIGKKLFRTIMDVQNYLKKISNISMHNYKYCGSDAFAACRYPFGYSAYIYVNMPVNDLFSLLEVENYYTHVEVYRDNVGLTDLPENKFV